MAKRIIVAVVCIPLLLAVLFLLPGVCWAAVVALISVLACWELLRAAGEGRITLPMQWAALLCAAAIPLGVWFGQGAVTACGGLFAAAAVCFWCAIRAYDEQGRAAIGLYHVLLTLFAAAAIPLGLSAMVRLRSMEEGAFLALLALALSFVTDGAAYFGGVFLGRHRGVTQVSPKKSVEGYAAGFLFGAVFGVVYGLAVSRIVGRSVNLLPLALVGLFGALCTELGDLVFSLIKRQFGVKDYGRVLPGHGGMLDRFDSAVFCAPVTLFIVRFLPVFGGELV